jgi:Flp pilus assembly protein TadG
MIRLRSLLWQFWRDRSGAVAVEFALTGLIMLATFLAVIEFGLGLYQYNAMSYAADVAVRRIYLDATVTTADLQSAARAAAPIGVNLVLISALTTVNAVKFRTITLQYPVMLLVPGLSHDAVTLTVKRMVQLE